MPMETVPLYEVVTECARRLRQRRREAHPPGHRRDEHLTVFDVADQLDQVALALREREAPSEARRLADAVVRVGDLLERHTEAVALAAIAGGQPDALRRLTTIATTFEVDDIPSRPTSNYHAPGCGSERRGCMPGCDNYDPKFDDPAGDGGHLISVPPKETD